MQSVLRWLREIVLLWLPIWLILALLPWKPETHLLPGEAREERQRFEFLLSDAKGPQSTEDSRLSLFDVPPEVANFLAAKTRVNSSSPLLTVGELQATAVPATVTWKEGKRNYSAGGVALTIRYRATASREIPESTVAALLLDLSEFSRAEPNARLIKKGGPRASNGFREIHLHPDGTSAFVAAAQTAGVIAFPFALAIHGIWRLRRAKRESKIAEAAPPDMTRMPVTFEENTALVPMVPAALQMAFGIVACIFSGLSYTDAGSTLLPAIPYISAGALAIAGIGGYFSGRMLRRVIADENGITIQRGKLGTIAALNWDEITEVDELQRTYRGTTSYWIQLRARGKKFKLTKGTIKGYGTLLELLLRRVGK